MLFPWTPLQAGGRTRRLMAPSSRLWMAAFVVLCARSSFAQTEDGGMEVAPAAAPASDVEGLRRELDATRKEMSVYEGLLTGAPVLAAGRS